MDENTIIILANTSKAERWEDQEKSTSDLNALREEFKKRLDSSRPVELSAPVARTQPRQQNA